MTTANTSLSVEDALHELRQFKTTILGTNEAEGIVEALVSTTNIVDHVDDVIVPGAYADTLKARMPKVCKSHDMKNPVGKTLHAEEWFPGDPRLPEAHRKADAGALFTRLQYNVKRDPVTGMYVDPESAQEFHRVQFMADDGEWSIGYDCSGKKGKTRRDAKTGARLIDKLTLWEVSTVLAGAAPMTGTISAKSLELDPDIVAVSFETKDTGGEVKAFRRKPGTGRRGQAVDGDHDGKVNDGTPSERPAVNAPDTPKPLSSTDSRTRTQDNPDPGGRDRAAANRNNPTAPRTGPIATGTYGHAQGRHLGSNVQPAPKRGAFGSFRESITHADASRNAQQSMQDSFDRERQSREWDHGGVPPTAEEISQTQAEVAGYEAQGQLDTNTTRRYLAARDRLRDMQRDALWWDKHLADLAASAGKKSLIDIRREATVETWQWKAKPPRKPQASLFSGANKKPRDADKDGRVYDGTTRERPAMPSIELKPNLPAAGTAGSSVGGEHGNAGGHAPGNFQIVLPEPEALASASNDDLVRAYQATSLMRRGDSRITRTQEDELFTFGDEIMNELYDRGDSDPDAAAKANQLIDVDENIRKMLLAEGAFTPDGLAVADPDAANRVWQQLKGGGKGKGGKPSYTPAERGKYDGGKAVDKFLKDNPGSTLADYYAANPEGSQTGDPAYDNAHNDGVLSRDRALGRTGGGPNRDVADMSSDDLLDEFGFIDERNSGDAPSDPVEAERYDAMVTEMERRGYDPGLEVYSGYDANDNPTGFYYADQGPFDSYAAAFRDARDRKRQQRGGKPDQPAFDEAQSALADYQHATDPTAKEAARQRYIAALNRAGEAENAAILADPSHPGNPANNRTPPMTQAQLDALPIHTIPPPIDPADLEAHLAEANPWASGQRGVDPYFAVSRYGSTPILDAQGKPVMDGVEAADILTADREQYANSPDQLYGGLYDNTGGDIRPIPPDHWPERYDVQRDDVRELPDEELQREYEQLHGMLLGSGLLGSGGYGSPEGQAFESMVGGNRALNDALRRDSDLEDELYNREGDRATGTGSPQDRINASRQFNNANAQGRPGDPSFRAPTLAQRPDPAGMSTSEIQDEARQMRMITTETGDPASMRLRDLLDEMQNRATEITGAGDSTDNAPGGRTGGGQTILSPSAAGNRKPSPKADEADLASLETAFLNQITPRDDPYDFEDTPDGKPDGPEILKTLRKADKLAKANGAGPVSQNPGELHDALADRSGPAIYDFRGDEKQIRDGVMRDAITMAAVFPDASTDAVLAATATMTDRTGHDGTQESDRWTRLRLDVINSARRALLNQRGKAMPIVSTEDILVASGKAIDAFVAAELGDTSVVTWVEDVFADRIVAGIGSWPEGKAMVEWWDVPVRAWDGPSPVIDNAPRFMPVAGVGEAKSDGSVECMSADELIAAGVAYKTALRRRRDLVIMEGDGEKSYVTDQDRYGIDSKGEFIDIETKGYGMADSAGPVPSTVIDRLERRRRRRKRRPGTGDVVNDELVKAAAEMLAEVQAAVVDEQRAEFKIGRMISAANLGRIQEAVDHLQSVIDACAEKMPADHAGMKAERQLLLEHNQAVAGLETPFPGLELKALAVPDDELELLAEYEKTLNEIHGIEVTDNGEVKRKFTQAMRDHAAATGAAEDDGSYPIENRSDLVNAVQAYRGDPKDKAHIIKRARALNAMSALPDDWR